MNVSMWKNIAIRATVLGVVLASTAGLAVAQAKPAGPPVTTKGAVKSNPKADKGQATAETARAEARERKAEKSAMSLARGEPKSLLRGIRFTGAERNATRDIEKRYADQFRDLEKGARISDKAGAPDAALIARIDALRLQERRELRAALTPEQQVRFDENIAALGTKTK